MQPCTKQGSLAVQLNHYKDFKPWFVAVPSLIFCFRNNNTFCTCSNMMSTLLPPNCVQNVFKSPETQISIYKSVQLPRSLKPQAAPSGFFKVSHSFHCEALLKNQPGLLSSFVGWNLQKSSPNPNHEREMESDELDWLLMVHDAPSSNFSNMPFSKHQQISPTIN